MIFDRSGYNRAGVERVMGFCTEHEVKRASRSLRSSRSPSSSPASSVEVLAGGEPRGVNRRLELRIDDGRKIWKLSPMDRKSYSRWFDYSRARDEIFKATGRSWAPWYVAHSDDKKRARLNIITTHAG